MKIVFLGTGTSVGVPMIGCACQVCRSPDPRNRRRRSSLYLSSDDVKVVVDTPPDFREQVLDYSIPRIDAVLLTHCHADHVFGFDDLRRFNTIQKTTIPTYGAAETIDDMKRIFDYVCLDKEPGVFRPDIEFLTTPPAFSIQSLTVTPIPVEHGPKATQGYLFCDGRHSVGYVPDCHAIDDSQIARLKNIDIMILDALRHRPHATHLTVQESLSILDRISARRSYMTHMCHDLDHQETQDSLPPNVFVSYDGLTVEC